jgi:RNA polymerase sigma factor (sigma-70 family)
MATRRKETLVQGVCQTLCRDQEQALTDAHLLKRFAEHEDEAAFAALVRRHGPMVMGVCRRVAQNPHDAEDAFQAAFLILVRKAASIARRELLAGWLYGVAYHAALKVRVATMKRRTREKQVMQMPDPAARESDPCGAEVLALLDRELSRLPQKYQAPILLCDLEGKTRKEAALLLACPEGSLSSRLSRARALLAKRLARHGLAVSGGALAEALARPEAAPALPPAVVASTVESAASIAAGHAAAGIAPKVTDLTEGVLKAMLLTKLKKSVLVLVVGLLVLAMVGSVYRAFTREPAEANSPDRQRPRSDQRAAAARADEKSIQGTWKVVSAERYGLTWKNIDGEFVMQDPRPMAFPISPELPGRVTFAGHDCSSEYAQEEGRTLVEKDTFTLDPARKPKWITLTAADGAIICGIYVLDGDELRLCWQYGPHRGLRPRDFKTKTETDQEDDNEIWVLKRQAPQGRKKVERKGESKAVPIQQSWEGILPKRRLIKESPPDGFVVEAEAWAKMWRAWRGKEKIPAIDFDRQLAIILTVSGPNRIQAPVLRIDAAGNVRVSLPASTSLPDDGRIGYRILLIDRTGVQSVNGRSIFKPVPGRI